MYPERSAIEKYCDKVDNKPFGFFQLLLQEEVVASFVSNIAHTAQIGRAHV